MELGAPWNSSGIEAARAGSRKNLVRVSSNLRTTPGPQDKAHHPQSAPQGSPDGKVRTYDFETPQLPTRLLSGLMETVQRVASAKTAVHSVQKAWRELRASTCACWRLSPQHSSPRKSGPRPGIPTPSHTQPWPERRSCRQRKTRSRDRSDQRETAPTGWSSPPGITRKRPRPLRWKAIMSRDTWKENSSSQGNLRSPGRWSYRHLGSGRPLKPTRSGVACATPLRCYSISILFLPSVLQLPNPKML